MFDIITFGSAVRDIFVRSNKFLTLKDKKFATGSGLCLAAGSKIEIDRMFFSSGGGGTNTAAAFARQGFKTAFCGMIGDDIAGASIIRELEDSEVGTDFVAKNAKKLTSHSIVFSSDSSERTIMTYRGASNHLSGRDISWEKLKARWFYLAPLSGKSALLFERIVDFAKDNKISLAVNPGMSQLCLPRRVLENILLKIDILFLNQEEASFLTKIPYKNEKEIFKKLDDLVQGICIMTKGQEGVVASDGRLLYSAPILKIEVADRTGAGDSFASGFLSGFIKSKEDIEYAIQLGVANSAACLSRWGAKEGLLIGSHKFRKVRVKKEPCVLNGLCQIKV